VPVAKHDICEVTVTYEHHLMRLTPAVQTSIAQNITAVESAALRQLRYPSQVAAAQSARLAESGCSMCMQQQWFELGIKPPVIPYMAKHSLLCLLIHTYLML
jgi:hypothetical protein